jgi:replication-associated recombination protein RarA
MQALCARLAGGVTAARPEAVDLFDHAAQHDTAGAPLADRMRPRRIDEIIGQRHLLAPGKLLHQAIAQDRIPSLILWGPPGTGKTSLAQVLARETSAHFVPFSAVLSGVPELREQIAKAKDQKRLYQKRTLLFVDEIHRFNKAQQDALLPHVEKGTVTLVGATTENPSFAVNAALLSRARVFKLEPLAIDDVVALLRWPLAREGTHAERSMCWSCRRATRLARACPSSSSVPSRRRCHSAPCSTTRAVKSTTMWSAPSSSRCAAAIPTPLSTG